MTLYCISRGAGPVNFGLLVLSSNLSVSPSTSYHSHYESAAKVTGGVMYRPRTRIYYQGCVSKWSLLMKC